MNRIFLLFVLIISSFSLAQPSDPNRTSPPPKWTRADIWNTKLCENMKTGKVRMLLGQPLLEYSHGQNIYWFYQSIPAIENKYTSADPMADSPNVLVKRKLILPKHGYVVFSKEIIGSEFKPYESLNPIYSDNYILSKWIAPDWAKVAFGKPETHKHEKEVTPSRKPQKWQIKRNWLKLRKEMNPSQVERLLGLPKSDDNRIPGERKWIYDDIEGHSLISFRVYDDKPEYYLAGWEEPYWPDIERQLCETEKESAEIRQKK